MIQLTFRLQEKNKRRYSVFLEDCYLFSISRSTYEKLAGSDGTVWVENIEAFQKACQEADQYHYCLWLLSRRAYSSEEIRRKLLEKHYSEEIADAILQKLTEEKLLCDEDYRDQFVRSRQIYGKQGFYKIRQDLMRRGISLSLQEYDREAELANLRELVRNFLDKKTDPQKIIRRLENRGYRFSDILSCIKELSAQDVDLICEETDYD